MARRYKVLLGVALATLVLDQLTKIWARTALIYGHPGITVIDGFFDLRLSFNRGSAFGLFSDMQAARVVLTIAGIVACVALVVMMRRVRDDQSLLAWGFGLVAGGAVGNVLDRVLFGQVTDFVVWKIQRYEWPTFNIADAALCVGIAFILLDGKKPEPTQPSA